MFSKEELIHYRQHIILPQIQLEGQIQLKKKSVLIIGMGGLGVPLAQYLTAAGIGKIGLMDFDCVDKSNLNRQVLYGMSMLGKSKAECAKERLNDLNPHIIIDSFNDRLTTDNAMDIIASYDVIADATDNFQARYLINDACVLTNRPNVSGSVYKFEGQLSVFNYKQGPCYRCLYPNQKSSEKIPSCAEAGVFGVLPAIIGSLQATEVLKILLNIGTVTSGKLIMYDALSMQFTDFKIDKNNHCPVCGDNPSITSLADLDLTLCCTDSSGLSNEITPTMLSTLLGRGYTINLIDVREPVEYEICHIDGAHLIPLNQISMQSRRFDKTVPIVVYCKVGIRSDKAAKFLRKQGFRSVQNLSGGIIQWINDVDPSLQKY